MMPTCAMCKARFDSRVFYVRVLEHAAGRDERICRTCWGNMARCTFAISCAMVRSEETGDVMELAVSAEDNTIRMLEAVF